MALGRSGKWTIRWQQPPAGDGGKTASEVMPEFDWEAREVGGARARIGDGAGGSHDLGGGAVLPEDVCAGIRRGMLVGHGLRPLLGFLLERAHTLPSTVFCTEAAAGLLAAGGDADTGLEAVAARFLRTRGADSPRPAPGPSEELIRLAGSLSRAMRADGLQPVFDLEMRVLPALASCDVVGLPVDRSALTGLRDRLLREAGACAFRLGNLLGNPRLDPDNAARMERTLARAGIPVRHSGEAALLAANEGRIIPEVFVYRRLSALARMCQELLDATAGEPGRIPGGGFQNSGSGALEELLTGSLHPALRAPGNRRLVVHRTDAAGFDIVRGMAGGTDEADPDARTASAIFEKPEDGLAEEELRVGRVVNEALLLGHGADTMAGEVLRRGLRLPGDPHAIRKAFFLRHAAIARWHEACQKLARDRVPEARTPLGRRLAFSPGANSWQRFRGLVETAVRLGTEDLVKAAAARRAADLPPGARLVGISSCALCVECEDGEEAPVRQAMLSSHAGALESLFAGSKDNSQGGGTKVFAGRLKLQ